MIRRIIEGQAHTGAARAAVRPLARDERHRCTPDAGGVEGAGESSAVDPGGTDHGERRIGAARHTHVGTLEQTGAGIPRGAVERGHRRRGGDPRQRGRRPRQRRLPPGTRHDLESRGSAVLALPQLREFPQRECVPHRNVVFPDERPAGRREQRSLGRREHTTQRIRAVEHDKQHPRVGAGVQQMPQGPRVGIEPRAHIGDIEQHRIETGEMRGGWTHPFAVQGHDGQAGEGIGAVGHARAVGGTRTKAMLGPEQAHQRQAGLQQGNPRPYVRRRRETRRVVGNQRHMPPVTPARGLTQHHVDAEVQGHGDRGRWRGRQQATDGRSRI